MAVRHFDYAEAKATMAKVQDEANKVKTYLAKCDSIINENVGVENRWSGQRATDFKQKWEKAAANFENFVQLINNYANKIDESYRVHQQFDQTQN
ncbi:MAG: WXG100 family type VII secretion target [bacterium]|nr:WXG100 family type VII secretion target [bacterium]